MQAAGGSAMPSEPDWAVANWAALPALVLQHLVSVALTAAASDANGSEWRSRSKRPLALTLVATCAPWRDALRDTPLFWRAVALGCSADRLWALDPPRRPVALLRRRVRHRALRAAGYYAAEECRAATGGAWLHGSQRLHKELLREMHDAHDASSRASGGLARAAEEDALPLLRSVAVRPADGGIDATCALLGAPGCAHAGEWLTLRLSFHATQYPLMPPVLTLLQPHGAVRHAAVCAASGHVAQGFLGQRWTPALRLPTVLELSGADLARDGHAVSCCAPTEAPASGFAGAGRGRAPAAGADGESGCVSGRVVWRDASDAPAAPRLLRLLHTPRRAALRCALEAALHAGGALELPAALLCARSGEAVTAHRESVSVWALRCVAWARERQRRALLLRLLRWAACLAAAQRREAHPPRPSALEAALETELSRAHAWLPPADFLPQLALHDRPADSEHALRADEARWVWAQLRDTRNALLAEQSAADADAASSGLDRSDASAAAAPLLAAIELRRLAAPPLRAVIVASPPLPPPPPQLQLRSSGCSHLFRASKPAPPPAPPPARVLHRACGAGLLAALGANALPMRRLAARQLAATAATLLDDDAAACDLQLLLLMHARTRTGGGASGDGPGDAARGGCAADALATQLAREAAAGGETRCAHCSAKMQPLTLASWLRLEDETW
jgi:hypothetical protein